MESKFYCRHQISDFSNAVILTMISDMSNFDFRCTLIYVLMDQLTSDLFSDLVRGLWHSWLSTLPLRSADLGCVRRALTVFFLRRLLTVWLNDSIFAGHQLRSVGIGRSSRRQCGGRNHWTFTVFLQFSPKWNCPKKMFPTEKQMNVLLRVRTETCFLKASVVLHEWGTMNALVGVI